MIMIMKICVSHMQHIKRLAGQQFMSYSKAGVVAEESISAIRIVQGFCGEDKQVKR